jgi:F-box associated protein
MKTSFDNFSPLTNQTTPHHSLSKSSLSESSLSTLTEELVLHIFAKLSDYTLRQLCSVCKSFEKYANNDNLWSHIAQSILFANELKFKPKNISFKDYCKESVSYQIVGNDQLYHHKYALKQRDQVFVDKIRQMNLGKYFELLNPSATRALLQKNVSIKLLLHKAINRVPPFIPFTIHHVAEQIVGDLTYEIINCTDYVISVTSHQELLINNKNTNIMFSGDDRQLLIITFMNRFFIYDYAYSTGVISAMHCNLKDLDLDNLTTIIWTGDNSSKS